MGDWGSTAATSADTASAAGSAATTTSDLSTVGSMGGIGTDYTAGANASFDYTAPATESSATTGPMIDAPADYGTPSTWEQMTRGWDSQSGHQPGPVNSPGNMYRIWSSDSSLPYKLGQTAQAGVKDIGALSKMGGGGGQVPQAPNISSSYTAPQTVYGQPDNSYSRLYQMYARRR